MRSPSSVRAAATTARRKHRQAGKRDQNGADQGGEDPQLEDDQARAGVAAVAARKREAERDRRGRQHDARLQVRLRAQLDELLVRIPEQIVDRRPADNAVERRRVISRRLHMAFRLESRHPYEPKSRDGEDVVKNASRCYTACRRRLLTGRSRRSRRVRSESSALEAQPT